MQCDFITVTDLLMNNMSSSVTMNYNNLLNMLSYKVITVGDLDGFSEELRQDLEQIVKNWSEERQN